MKVDTSARSCQRLECCVHDDGAHYREVIGRHFPAMAVVVVVVMGPMEAEANVEIEVTG